MIHCFSVWTGLYDPGNSMSIPKVYTDGTFVEDSDLGDKDWPHSEMR